MPAGVPVATVAIGGGKNAGILAVEILALSNEAMSDKLTKYKEEIAIESRIKNENMIFTQN